MLQEMLSEAVRSMPERQWRSPALRRLHKPAVDLSNQLCRHRGWRVDWFGVPALVDVVGVQWFERAAAPPSHELLTRVHWRGMACCLGLSHVAAEAALSGHVGTVLWKELPPGVALALLQDGADRLATANPALGVLRFETMADEGTLSCGLCAVQLRVKPEGSGNVIDLHWLVEPEVIDQHLFSRQVPGTSRSEELLRDWGGLPIPLAFELGWVHLPLSELQGLRSEDVLLPDGWWAKHGSGRVGLRVGARSGWDRGFAGVLDEARHRIKVTGPQKMERDLPEDVLSEAGNLSALGDLPVRLTFDLGERSLTLHELASLGAGHVFDLGLSPRHGVNLRVNGMLMGEGEIVEIDGRLGVAVTRILPPRA